MEKLSPIAKRVATMGKCRRAVCKSADDGCVHTQTGDSYCRSCAVKINRANPEVPNLITIPPPRVTTGTGAGLLASVLRDPGDDTVRLVFADWLSEHGDEPRAEFIRVQVEIATRPDCGHAKTATLYLDGSCGYCELRYRERGLWAVYGHAWYAARPGGVAVAIVNHDTVDIGTLVGGLKAPIMVVRRGFVDEVRCTLAEWCAHGPRIVEEYPVGTVRLSDKCCVEGAWDHAPCWVRRGRRDGRDRLPGEMFDLLPATGLGHTCPEDEGQFWWFNDGPSEAQYVTNTRRAIADADEALSRVCLMWAGKHFVRGANGRGRDRVP